MSNVLHLNDLIAYGDKITVLLTRFQLINY